MVISGLLVVNTPIAALIAVIWLCVSIITTLALSTLFIHKENRFHKSRGHSFVFLQVIIRDV